MKILRRLLFPGLLLLVAWMSYGVTVRPVNAQGNGFLQIEAVPGGTVVKVDGKGVRGGKTSVTPGSHTVIFSKPGFGSVTRKVSATDGQTVYVGAALHPDSPQTRNWYLKHPADEQQAEGIGSHQADYENQTATQANPFLDQLPLVYGDGHGGLVKIGQGASLFPGGPPAVYVSAATPAVRQSVLTYIRSRSYDPADMDLVFYNQSNPLDTSGE